jgi:phospholipid/cholesterol/gamma-HCH transport system permease protein
MSRRSTLPFDPRRSLHPEHSLVGRLGRSALERWARFGGMVATLGAAAISVRTPGTAAAAVVRRVLLNQIFYTGFQAVGLVSMMGLLLGATIVIQTELMVPSADPALTGKVMVAVVLRELAPLITAIVVAGRSGTAIATELGNMKVSAELLALTSLGIDPPRFIVMPRLVAMSVSVVLLMVYFAAVALAGALGVRALFATTSFEALHAGISAAITPYDLGLFVAKGLGLGSIVGWFCCHYGLQVKVSPTEVPQMASRAVVMSLLGAVAYNTVATAIFYFTVGPPLR